MSTELIALIDKSFKEIREGSIVIGRIIEIQPQVVLVDIGYKSEGAIPISEFEDEDIEVGNDIEVLLERLENDEGMVVLSKEKAAHKQNWDKIVKVFHDGGLVKGKVKAVVKGGLMVNVGVEAFLPGSQIDIKSKKKSKCHFILSEKGLSKKNITPVLLERPRITFSLFLISFAPPCAMAGLPPPPLPPNAVTAHFTKSTAEIL